MLFLDFFAAYLDIFQLCTSKGLLFGKLLFEDGVSCTHAVLSIQESLLNKTIVDVGRFLLVVEKDATFQKLIQEGFARKFPDGLLATARGYPDLCTRHVLRSITKHKEIPCFCLTDADPHGLAIYLTYRYGAELTTAENEDCFVPGIEWLGMMPSDVRHFPVAANQFLKLERNDKKRISGVLGRAMVLKEMRVVEEVSEGYGKRITVDCRGK
ncbi:hypothetical protein L596_013441 [Steinernema carpocapsae]|uniref:Topoisomerase 6 subunit A/Spo11 TOPRIM domain-containing protein n=1 Tax=Steinernema carpocapsae TaxID=34508 RepID=A0A4V6A535_STECR|nr:hypothetical protein L596_013441 [Steinernema carpocapsae]